MEQTLLYIITAMSVITCICVIITMILVISSTSGIKKKLDSVIQKCSSGASNRSESDILKGKTELLGEMKTAIASVVAEQMRHEEKQLIQALRESQPAQSVQQAQTDQSVQMQSAPMQSAPVQSAPVQQAQIRPVQNEMNQRSDSVTSVDHVQDKEDLEHTLLMPKIEIEKRGSVLCRKCYKPYPSTERECPYCKTKQ